MWDPDDTPHSRVDGGDACGVAIQVGGTVVPRAQAVDACVIHGHQVAIEVLHRREGRGGEQSCNTGCVRASTIFLVKDMAGLLSS